MSCVWEGRSGGDEAHSTVVCLGGFLACSWRGITAARELGGRKARYLLEMGALPWGTILGNLGHQRMSPPLPHWWEPKGNGSGAALQRQPARVTPGFRLAWLALSHMRSSSRALRLFPQQDFFNWPSSKNKVLVVFQLPGSSLHLKSDL